MRICYIGYIINLIVQAFLFIGMVELEVLKSYNNQEKREEYTDKEVIRAKFRLLGLLGKEYNIIVYICRSASRIVQFVKLIGRLVPIDNYIR
jgi:hypothetical protein